MNIVKIPKKLRDVSETLRSGQIESGLEQLEQLTGFEPQKAIIRAEIGYFRGDCETAMTNDENGLPYDGQWYSGNVLSEHFFAYSNTALISGNVSRAQAFYKGFLSGKEKSNLPEHSIKMYRHQVKNHLDKLKGEKNLAIDKKQLRVVKHGKQADEFAAQLKAYRPKLTFDSREGAEYLLHFTFEEGTTDESLPYYEKFADQIASGDHHIHAGRLYQLIGQTEKAKAAIMRFVKNWHPVEYIQIAPMILFSYEDLQPLLTIEFKQEILQTPKGKY